VNEFVRITLLVCYDFIILVLMNPLVLEVVQALALVRGKEKGLDVLLYVVKKHEKFNMNVKKEVGLFVLKSTTSLFLIIV